MRPAWVCNSVVVQFKAFYTYRIFYLLKCFVVYFLTQIKNWDNGLGLRCSFNQYYYGYMYSETKFSS